MADHSIPAARLHDRFPEGTVMSVYLQRTQVAPGGKPSGAPVATATVGAEGATWTGLDVGVAYLAHAVVGGQDRFLNFLIPNTTPGPRWPDVVAARLDAITGS